MEEKKYCKFCGEKIDKSSIVCSKCGRQLEIVKKTEEKVEKTVINNQNKFYEKQWFMWVMLVFFAPVGIFLMWKFNNTFQKKTKIILTIVFAIFFIIVASNSGENTATNDSSSSNNNNSTPSTEVSKKKVTIIDFSSMKEHEILIWCNDNNLTCNFKREYSNTVVKDGFIKQSINAEEQVLENTKITITYSLGKEPTMGQKNALKKAESYSKLMHMSKAKIYEQLTSEYGEGFTAEEAQYAIDNIEADWKANALAKAKSYQTTMNMSKSRIYEQLTSQYGEGFTAEEAQYAIDNLAD